MRLPLPQNKLVALTLVGAIAAAGASVALAVPDLTGGAAVLPEGAPADDPGFQPAVLETHEDDDHEGEEEHDARERALHEADEADER